MSTYIIPLIIVIVGLLVYHMFVGKLFGLSSYEESYQANA